MPSSPAFDPYHRWLGIPPKDQPPHHYRLLGTELYEDDPDVIATAADQRMTHLKTFQNGANAAHSQRLLNEVAAAQFCLLDGAQKSAYDATLRARLAPPAAQPQTAPTPVPAPRAAKPLAKARPLIAVETPAVEPLAVGESASIDSLEGLADAHGLAKRNRKAKGASRQTTIGVYALIGIAAVLIGLATLFWGGRDDSQAQLADRGQGQASSDMPAEKSSTTNTTDVPRQESAPRSRPVEKAEPADVADPKAPTQTDTEPDATPDKRPSHTEANDADPAVSANSVPQEEPSADKPSNVPDSPMSIDGPPRKPRERIAPAPSSQAQPAAPAAGNAPLPTSEQTPQLWRYKFSKPATGWHKPDFHDADWNTGPGGFGIDAPTTWNAREIWLRREFELVDLNLVPSVIRVRRGQEVEIYINGVMAGHYDGAYDYGQADVDVAALRAYRVGRNVLAVHSRQGTGPQFIDVGLVDLRRPPKFRPYAEVKAARGKPIDLLKIIDPERDAVEGRWEFKGPALTCAPAIRGRLQIPYAPPPEYSLTVVGERVSGVELSIGLVMGGAQVLLVIDGGNPATTGLTAVDGKDLYHTPAINRAHDFLGDGHYTVTCNVRENEVAIFSNGQAILSWQGSPSRLALPDKWDVPCDDQLFLGAGEAVHRFTSITIVPLSKAAGAPKKPPIDPIGAELAKGKQAYQTALEKARQKLLAAFDVEIKKVSADSPATDSAAADQPANLTEQLEAERKLFEADSNKLPESRVLREAAHAYRSAASAARTKCIAAYNKAAKAYQKKQDLENSNLVLEELETFLHPPL